MQAQITNGYDAAVTIAVNKFMSGDMKMFERWIKAAVRIRMLMNAH